VPSTNEFHEFCWSTISGTTDDGKAPYGPKSMHIFIMSKIRHSHRQYDTRKWHGIKHRLNRAKVWSASHITLASRPRVDTFPKPIFTTCQGESVRGVSNLGMAVQGGNLATRPSCMASWPAGLSSGPHAPNLWPRHCLTPPTNTMVLSLEESVKRVRFSPPIVLPSSFL
jgi:hypothetical protein